MPSSRSGTLVAMQVTTVQINAGDFGVNITNRADSPSFVIWARIDGADPVIGGDDSFIVQGTRSFYSTGTTTVKLISAYPVAYTVDTD